MTEIETGLARNHEMLANLVELYGDQAAAIINCCANIYVVCATTSDAQTATLAAVCADLFAVAAGMAKIPVERAAADVLMLAKARVLVQPS